MHSPWFLLLLVVSSLSIAEPTGSHAARAKALRAAGTSAPDFESLLLRQDPNWLNLDRATQQANEARAQGFLKELTGKFFAGEDGSSSVFRIATDSWGVKSLKREKYDIKAVVHLPEERYYPPYHSTGSAPSSRPPEADRFDDGAAISYEEELETSPHHLAVITSGQDYLLIEVLPRDESILPRRRFVLYRKVPAGDGEPEKLVVSRLILDSKHQEVEAESEEILEVSSVARADWERHGKNTERPPSPSEAPNLKRTAIEHQSARGPIRGFQLAPGATAEGKAVHGMSQDLKRSTRPPLPPVAPLYAAADWARTKSESMLGRQQKKIDELGNRSSELLETITQRENQIARNKDRAKENREELQIASRNVKSMKEIAQRWDKETLEPLRKIIAVPEVLAVIKDRESFQAFFDKFADKSYEKFDYYNVQMLLELLQKKDLTEVQILSALNSPDLQAGVRTLRFVGIWLTPEANEFIIAKRKEFEEYSDKRLAQSAAAAEKQKAKTAGALKAKQAEIVDVQTEADMARYHLSQVDKGLSYYFTRQSTLDANAKKYTEQRDVGDAQVKKLRAEMYSMEEAQSSEIEKLGGQRENLVHQLSKDRDAFMEKVRKHVDPQLRLQNLVEAAVAPFQATQHQADRPLTVLADNHDRVHKATQAIGQDQLTAIGDTFKKISVAVMRDRLTKLEKLRAHEKETGVSLSKLYGVTSGWFKQIQNVVTNLNADAQGKLPKVTYGGREMTPVLSEMPSGMASVAKESLPSLGPDAKFFWLDLHDSSRGLNRDERLMVVTSQGEHGEQMHVFSMAPGAPVEQVADFPLFTPLKEGKAQTPTTLQNLTVARTPYHRTVQDVRLLKDFPEFDKIRASLQRQGLMPEKFDLNKVKVAYVPGTNSDFERAHSTVAYVKTLPGAAASIPMSTEESRELLKTNLDDLTLFSRVPLENLERGGSQIPMHEVVHLIRHFGRNAAYDPKDEAAPTKEQFEAAVPSMIEAERKSPEYSANWKAYRTRNLHRLVGATLKFPEATEKLLQAEFEEKTYGKDFAKHKYLWRQNFNYVNKPEETAGWRAAMSYMKREQGLSFDDAMVAFARSMGSTAESTDRSSAWFRNQLRSWWDAE